MNIIDILILVILAAGAINGLRVGFIVEVAVIVGVIVGLMVARAEYHVVVSFLAPAFHRSAWLTAFSYLVVFAVVWGIIISLAFTVRRLVRLFLLGPLDRLGGGVIGLLQGAIVVELLLSLGRRVPWRALHTAIHHSKLASSFLHVVPFVDRLFPPGRL